MSQFTAKWKQPARRAGAGRQAASIIVPSYLVSIVAAEVIGVFVAPVAGALCQALLVAALLTHTTLAGGAPYRRLLPALALVPLLRLLSLAMPVRFVPPIYWYSLIGAPLLVAVILAAWLLELSPRQLGLRIAAWPAQLAIALSGVPLSLAAFLVLRPPALLSLDGLSWPAIGLSLAALALFTGFVEELLFRGVLQRVAEELFGASGVIYSSVLFAAVYLGSASAGYLLFVALVGLFFGWCARRTGSIWGVIGAHSLISVCLTAIWPYTSAARW